MLHCKTLQLIFKSSSVLFNLLTKPHCLYKTDNPPWLLLYPYSIAQEGPQCVHAPFQNSLSNKNIYRSEFGIASYSFCCKATHYHLFGNFECSCCHFDFILRISYFLGDSRIVLSYTINSSNEKSVLTEPQCLD